MRLKNIDKYIKDKLQGYKPAYDEDMWKRLEESLPASRVPEGKGSWLIPAAAAVVVLTLVPALLKLNNLADRNGQNMAVQTEKPVQGRSFSNNTIADNGMKPGAGQDAATRAGGAKDNSVQTLHTHGHRQINVNFAHAYKKHNNADGHQPEHTIDQPQPQQTAQNNQDISEKNGAAGNDRTEMALLNTSLESIKQLDNPAAMADMYRGGKPKTLSIAEGPVWDNWQSIYEPFWKNPAYTGSEGRYNITVDDKINFVSVSKTSNYVNDFAFDTRLPFWGISAGVYHTSDLSPFQLQSVTGLALSKIVVHSGNMVLKAGVSGNIIENSLFYNSLNYPDQIDPLVGVWRATAEKDPAAKTTATGINAGLWMTNNHLVAGMDVENINEPRPHHLAEAAPLPRLYRLSAGYRIAAGKYLQVMPMVEMRRQNNINQASATLTAVIKNKFMITAAYQDIAPRTGLGNALVYAGADIAKKVRVFAGYGYNMEWAQFGVSQQFIHGGLKVQVQ